MTINYGSVGITVKKAVTSTDGTYLDPAMPNNPHGAWQGQYVLSTDGVLFFDVNESATATGSPSLTSATPAIVTLQDGDVLHFVRETADCGLWITQKA